MSEGEDRARTIGMALLTLTSLVSGILAASVPSTEAYEPLGEIGGGQQAYAVELTSGERVRFALDDDARDETRFAVYDPNDRFFGHFKLDGGEHVELIADRSGRWVVLPTLSTGANLSVESTSVPEDAPAAERLASLPVRDVERSIASGDGGELDTRVALRLSRTPASAFLQVHGQAHELDATVRSQQGEVFELEAARVNGSTSAWPEDASLSFHPGRLVPGAYTIRATAESFEGELTLVHRTYIRSGDEAPRVNASLSGIEELGIPIAAMQEGQAFLIDRQEASRIRFAAAPDTSARILLYDETDQVDAIALLGPQRGYRWDWQTDEANRTLETAEVVIRGADAYVAYVAELYGHGDRVYALLPDLRTAEPARQLAIEQTGMELGSELVVTSRSQTVTTNVSGGLVDVRLAMEDLASGEHRVRVSGPLGLVFDHVERTTVAGSSQTRTHEEHPTHYTAGRYEVEVEARQTADSDLRVTLVYYER